MIFDTHGKPYVPIKYTVGLQTPRALDHKAIEQDALAAAGAAHIVVPDLPDYETYSMTQVCSWIAQLEAKLDVLIDHISRLPMRGEADV